MAMLETRVRKLEEPAAHVYLESMTDEELMQYTGTPWKSPPWGFRESVAAVLTTVLHTPSAFKPVPTEKLPPDYFQPQRHNLSGEDHGQP